MADRPCDCLHPKNPLRSCQLCQWFCAGRHIVSICQARITRPKRHLPNAYKILVTQYDQFRLGVDHFRRIFHREGASPPTAVGIRELEYLPFRVVSKYPQCII